MIASHIRSAGGREYVPKFTKKSECGTPKDSTTPEGGGGADGFQSIRNLQDYFNNDRNTIELTIQSNEPTDEETRWFGNTIWETIRINSSWMKKVIRFFLYFIIGVAVYEHLEHWSFQNSVYFIVQTITTVGYGNITPSTTSGQIFTIFFAYAGMLLAFSIINEVTRILVVKLRNKYKKPKRLNKFQVLVRNVINVGMWIVILFFIPLIGAGIFCHLEGWTFEEAFYFSTITATSIGYGDRNVSDSAGVWFNCIYIIISVSATALALDKISSFKRHLKKAELWQILEDIPLTKALLDAVNKKTDKIHKAEYILHMLQLEGKLDYESDLARWNERFHEFDFDKDGYLSIADCHAYAEDVKRRKELEDPTTEKERSRLSSRTFSSSLDSSKNLIFAFTHEAKDVFFETIGFKKSEDEDNRNSSATTEPATPIQRAKALRRASAMNFLEESKKEDHPPLDYHYPTASIDGVEMKDVVQSSTRLIAETQTNPLTVINPLNSNRQQDSNVDDQIP